MKRMMDRNEQDKENRIDEVNYPVQIDVKVKEGRNVGL